MSEPQTKTLWRAVGIAIVAIVIAHLLDSWAYANVRVEDIYAEDYGRMLRVMGFLPLWLLAATALWLQDRSPIGRQRAQLLALAPIISGIAAELLKLIFRRERPGAHDGEYFLRAFDQRTFSTSGLALPSSHAMVAFGACFMLSRLFPRARVVWWLLGWGCALTRVAAGAHFLSDVVVAAAAAWFVVYALAESRLNRFSRFESGLTAG